MVPGAFGALGQHATLSVVWGQHIEPAHVVIHHQHLVGKTVRASKWTTRLALIKSAQVGYVH